MTGYVEAPAIQADRKRGPLSAADRIKPGFTRADLHTLFRGRGYTRGAEVGVRTGRHAEQLCRAIPGLELLCVDPWIAYQREDDPAALEAQTRARLEPFNATIVKATSMEAVWTVPHHSLDFVYIDGAHDFDHVMEDLIAWSRCVRSGGIVSGHDYYHMFGGGVVEAVNAYTAAHGITQWWIADERKPSFWWVKP